VRPAGGGESPKGPKAAAGRGKGLLVSTQGPRGQGERRRVRYRAAPVCADSCGGAALSVAANIGPPRLGQGNNPRFAAFKITCSFVAGNSPSLPFVARIFPAHEPEECIDHKGTDNHEYSPPISSAGLLIEMWEAEAPSGAGDSKGTDPRRVPSARPGLCPVAWRCRRTLEILTAIGKMNPALLFQREGRIRQLVVYQPFLRPRAWRLWPCHAVQGWLFLMGRQPGPRRRSCGHGRLNSKGPGVRENQTRPFSPQTASQRSRAPVRAQIAHA